MATSLANKLSKLTVSQQPTGPPTDDKPSDTSPSQPSVRTKTPSQRLPKPVNTHHRFRNVSKVRKRKTTHHRSRHPTKPPISITRRKLAYEFTTTLLQYLPRITKLPLHKMHKYFATLEKFDDIFHTLQPRLRGESAEYAKFHHEFEKDCMGLWLAMQWMVIRVRADSGEAETPHAMPVLVPNANREVDLLDLRDFVEAWRFSETKAWALEDEDQLYTLWLAVKRGTIKGLGVTEEVFKGAVRKFERYVVRLIRESAARIGMLPL